MNTVAAALSATSRGHGVDELELHIRPRLERLEEALHIFAKELPRQKRVAETVMQAGMVLTLVKLAEKRGSKSPGWPARIERSRVRTLRRCKGWCAP